jgi:hypothetical protein
MLIGIELAIQRERFIARGLLVSHIENLVARSQVLSRIAMAIQAPLHLQRRIIEHKWHAINRTMASVAANALIDMYAVVEINEIGQVVSARPH